MSKTTFFILIFSVFWRPTQVAPPPLQSKPTVASKAKWSFVFIIDKIHVKEYVRTAAPYHLQSMLKRGEIIWLNKIITPPLNDPPPLVQNILSNYERSKSLDEKPSSTSGGPVQKSVAFRLDKECQTSSVESTPTTTKRPRTPAASETSTDDDYRLFIFSSNRNYSGFLWHRLLK